MELPAGDWIITEMHDKHALIRKPNGDIHQEKYWSVMSRCSVAELRKLMQVMDKKIPATMRHIRNLVAEDLSIIDHAPYPLKTELRRLRLQVIASGNESKR